jgi:membrane associated rhomboid family serine protease
MRRFELTPVIRQILIGCIVLFIGTYLLNGREYFDLNNILAFHYPKTALFKPWQIITHMFMHGGIAHLAFNMFALVSLGVTIEKIIGSKKFFILFFVSGLGSILLHVAIQIWEVYQISGLILPSLSDLGVQVQGDKIFPDGTGAVQSQDSLNTVGRIYFGAVVGASGAIYGIAVAFAFLFPNTGLVFLFIPYPIKAKYMIPALIGLDLVFGFSNFKWDPIAHFAHVGGALTGFLLVYYWRKFDKANFW